MSLKILSIAPAAPGWDVVVDAGKPLHIALPVACWAQVEDDDDGLVVVVGLVAGDEGDGFALLTPDLLPGDFVKYNYEPE